MGRSLTTKIYSKRLTPWIVAALRLIVGSVFIFSGFVKAIDPWGSIYKFDDYINVLGLSGLHPFLLFFAVSVGVIEFVCGVFVLVGAYRRGAVWVLALMMLAMTPLTLWLAVTNSVPDCGCFGDAWVISNWSTFWKNVTLMLAIAYLLCFNKQAKNLFGVNVQWVVALLSFSFIFSVAMIGYFYQPMIDFRPYGIGKRLAAEAGANPADDGDNYEFIYEKGSEQKSFTINDVPDDSWTFVERRLKAGIKKTEGANIIVHDSNGDEVTDSVLVSEGEQILLLFPDMKDLDVTYTYLLNEMYDLAQSHGIAMIGLTSASDEDIAVWNDLSMASYGLFEVDDSELKMIARGNPAVVYLKDGKIVWKRTLQSLSNERLTSDRNDLEWVGADFNGHEWLTWLMSAFIFSMLGLLVLNRSYNVMKFSVRTIKKNQNKDVPLQSESKE